MNSIAYKILRTTFSQCTFVACIRSVHLKNHYSTFQEQKISLPDGDINYLKVGTGSNVILCFPGALGTIWSDFKPQITDLDKNIFTIVAFDPQGYGNSRPPSRKFDLDFYERDATMAYDLMKKLGIERFSLLGWSDGGISSLIVAGAHPEAVHKLVVWGANSYILPEDIEAFERMRDTRTWSQRMRTPLVQLYGERGLQDMWTGWCDAMAAMQRRDGGNICMRSVSRITCPTLVLHGAQDPVVLPEHPNYLTANIRNSRLHIFPQGKHNIHLRYAKEFNDIVTKFILE